MVTFCIGSLSFKKAMILTPSRSPVLGQYRTKTFQDFLKANSLYPVHYGFHEQRKLRITGFSHIYLFRNNAYLLVLHFTAFSRDSTGITALECGVNFCLFVAIRANRCLLSRLLVKGIHSARKIFSRSSCCVIRLVVPLLHLWARYSLTDVSKQVKTFPSRGPLKLK